MDSKLIISPSPHIHGGDSISKNMYGVLIALLPAFLVSLYCFGLGALVVTLVSVASCVIFEYLIQKYLFKREPTIADGSAILTGVLLAFNLPSNLPAWIVILGALFAIGVGKMSFGGLGNNIFNPALVGRVFLLISFPAQMTTWPVAGVFPLTYTDAQTGATTLSLIHFTKDIAGLGPSAIGLTGGSLGEMSEVALLLGFAYLIHLTSGGLMLGAVFMATDYVTSPMTKRGSLIYGAGIGLLTVLIRIFGSYPEGMSFSILIWNGLTPLINTYIKPKHFGGR